MPITIAICLRAPQNGSSTQSPVLYAERRCPDLPPPQRLSHDRSVGPTADLFLEIASLGLKLLTGGGSGSQLNRSGADREVIGIPRLPAPRISSPPLALARHRVLAVGQIG
jgi:hypothetical protein